MNILPLPDRATTPTACPPWCVAPAGHDGDPDTDGHRYVRHGGTLLGDGPIRLDLDQLDVVTPDGRVTTEPAVLLLDRRPDLALTAEQAARFADAVAFAAAPLGGAR